MLKRVHNWLVGVLRRLTTPDPIMLTLALTHHTASLELTKGQYVEFAPLKGCFGPIRLSGNSLPVFEYRVFNKKIMEFIRVRVEVARPNRITFICTIESTSAPERNGEQVETLPKYREPFDTLAYYLYQYFPFYTQFETNLLRKNIHETASLVHNQSPPTIGEIHRPDGADPSIYGNRWQENQSG